MAPGGGRRAASSAVWYSLGVCLFYASSSITLSLVNKSVLSAYDFPCYFLLLAVQLVVAIAFCEGSRRAGNPFGIPAATLERVRAALPMGLWFVVNVSVGFLALKLVNLPMFFCIRRLTPAFVLALDYLVQHVPASRATSASVFVSFVGTVLAGWETFSDDALGYALAFGNDIATAFQLLFQRRFSDGQKVSAFSLVYFNALVALPLTLAGAVVMGEFTALAEYPYLADRGFWGAITLSAGLGVVLTYAGVLCTVVNSPLATSMTGCAKDVVGTGVGAIAFGDFDFTLASTSGLLVSFVGSGMYAWAGYTESRAGRKAATGGKAVESPRPDDDGGGGGVSPTSGAMADAALERVEVGEEGRGGVGSDGGARAPEGAPLLLASTRSI